jgi:hypothetical protein
MLELAAFNFLERASVDSEAKSTFRLVLPSKDLASSGQQAVSPAIVLDASRSLDTLSFPSQSSFVIIFAVETRWFDPSCSTVPHSWV